MKAKTVNKNFLSSNQYMFLIQAMNHIIYRDVEPIESIYFVATFSMKRTSQFQNHYFNNFN